MSVIEKTQAIRSIHVYEHRGVDFKPEPVKDVMELGDFLDRNVSTPWIALFGLRGVVSSDYRPTIELIRGHSLFDDEQTPKIITPPGRDSSLVTVTASNHGLDFAGIRTQLVVLEDSLSKHLS